MNEISEKSEKERRKEVGCVEWKCGKSHFVNHRVDGRIVSREGGATFKHFSFEFGDKQKCGWQKPWSLTYGCGKWLWFVSMNVVAMESVAKVQVAKM